MEAELPKLLHRVVQHLDADIRKSLSLCHRQSASLDLRKNALWQLMVIDDVEQECAAQSAAIDPLLARIVSYHLGLKES